MFTAIVLIQTEQGRAPEVAEALLEINSVAEVYSVAGDYDLVAIVRVREYEQMAEVVPALQAAAAFRTTYDDGSLRQRLGLARPVSRYADAGGHR